VLLSRPSCLRHVAIASIRRPKEGWLSFAAVNLLVYVSDALRADHVGCYGARFVNTRTLDELAAGGLRFDDAIAAAPWTAPSLTSMVTGLYPHRHGCLAWDPEVDQALSTVFDRFVEAEYDVASFVFDTSYLFRGLRNANVRGETDTLDGAVAFLRAKRDRPFFAFIHSWATHMPRGLRHAEKKEWREAKLAFLAKIQSGTAVGLEACRAEYREGAEHASEVLVASLLEELDRLSLRESTVFLFVSDHGESWGERFQDKSQVKGIYHLHGATIYDEILQVPLILSAPGRLEPEVVHSQVSTVDIAPTLLELAGIDGLDADGCSLLDPVPDRDVYAATSDRGALSQVAVRRPPWKLIQHLADGREEAYRLDVDPRELVDRATEAPDELRFLLGRELDDVERRRLSPEEEAVVVSRLEDLGYL
jgi:arylsulfatase A-like enzyme